jgi:phage-related protein
LLAFPEAVKDGVGTALSVAQFGGKHPAAKPWKGEGSGVLEIIEDHYGNTYRAIYTVRLKRLYMSCMHFKRSRPGV